MARKRALTVGLLVLAVGGLAVGFTLQSLLRTEATTIGTGTMAFGVTGSGVSCNGDSSKCTVPLSGAFSLNVAVTDFPTGGYTSATYDLDWTGTGLTKTPPDCSGAAAEGVWPDKQGLNSCSELSATRFQGGDISLGLGSTPSTFKGNVFAFTMNCTAGNSSNAVSLVASDPSDNPLGASLTDDIGTIIPTSDSVLIHCGAEVVTNTPTFTPTSTATATATDTATPTDTPTVTQTPTPCPPEGCATPTITLTPTNTATFTPTSTPTRTITPTPTRTNTPGPTGTPTTTRTPTATVTFTPTNTPTITLTPTRTNTPTITNTPTVTNTPTATPTATPRIEKLIEHLPAGGKLSTDTEGDGATAEDPIEVSVTLPSITFPFGADVEINEQFITSPNPSGYQLLGQQVHIKAPSGNWQDPIIIVFLLDTSIIPEGESEATVQVFKNGARLRACFGAGTEAAPDPCVAKRHRLVGAQDGDVAITVLTSTASAWNFGLAVPPPTPTPPATPSSIPLGDANADGHVDSVDAFWILLDDAGLAAVPAPDAADVNLDGEIRPTDAALVLQFHAGFIDGLPPSGAASLLPGAFSALW